MVGGDYRPEKRLRGRLKQSVWNIFLNWIKQASFVDWLTANDIFMHMDSGYTNDDFYHPINEDISMATYECKVCGMSVNATCGKCDAPLENNMRLTFGLESPAAFKPIHADLQFPPRGMHRGYPWCSWCMMNSVCTQRTHDKSQILILHPEYPWWIRNNHAGSGHWFPDAPWLLAIHHETHDAP